MIDIIYIFILVWLQGFLLHEFCHLLEAYRQGASEFYIEVNWKPLPSLKAVAFPLIDQNMFALAGGLYTGLLLLPITVIAYLTHATSFFFPYLALTIVNLIYSVFEWRYLYIWPLDKYIKWHYVIYGIGLAIAFSIWWWLYEIL